MAERLRRARSLKVGRLFAQHAEKGLAPGGVAAQRMGRVLGHALDREPQQVDPVARREIELETMRLLKKLDRQGQECILGERQVVLEDLHLVVAGREPQREGRLKAGEDVVGDLVGRLVLVHRHADPKIGVGGDRDAGHDALDVTAVVEQAGPGWPMTSRSSGSPRRARTRPP